MSEGSINGSWCRNAVRSPDAKASPSAVTRCVDLSVSRQRKQSLFPSNDLYWSGRVEVEKQMKRNDQQCSMTALNRHIFLLDENAFYKLLIVICGQTGGL